MDPVFMFDQYNVIITPVSAISHSFPWDKVSLLIEYESNILNITPPPHSPSSFTHIVLHCVLDSNTSSVDETVSTGVSYTLIGSETIAQCPEILTSLETKYNFQIIVRDYHSLNVDAKKKASMLILRYHFSGNIPANIAKLQASLLIHRKLHTGYSVKVLYAFSYDDVGKLVKDLIELRLSEAPLEWNESREWLKEDFTQQELFLISFPCINSYSAQLMLRGKCLKDLLIMSLEELQANFPTLPVRSLEMFYKICNLESSVYCDFSNEEQNVPQTLSPSPHSSPHPPLNLFGTDIDTTDWNKSELEMIHANTSKRHRSLPPPSSSSSIAPLSTNTTIIPTDQSKDPYHHSFIDLTVNTGLPTNADLPISLRQVDGALINETAQLPINNSLPMNLTADGSNVLDQSAIKDTSLSSDIKALQSTHHNEDKESGINSHLSFPPISHSSSRSLLQRRPFKSLDLGFDTSNGSHTPLVTNDRPMVLGGGIPVDKRIERRDKRLPVLLERGVKRGPSTHTGLMLDTAAPVDHRLSLERRGLSLEKEFLVNKRTQSSGGQSLSSETLIPSHIRYGVATRVRRKDT
uniref:Uncharacterized protein n=1 Tax=Amphimedon queenslandica TaxID=400682 RepID=A0A1X7UGL7_AMPQE